MSVPKISRRWCSLSASGPQPCGGGDLRLDLLFGDASGERNQRCPVSIRPEGQPIARHTVGRAPRSNAPFGERIGRSFPGHSARQGRGALSSASVATARRARRQSATVGATPRDRPPRVLARMARTTRNRLISSQTLHRGRTRSETPSKSAYGAEHEIEDVAAAMRLGEAALQAARPIQYQPKGRRQAETAPPALIR